MHRHVIDRWADTTVFRCLLLLSAMAVLPVLAMGTLFTVFGGVATLAGPSAVELWHVVIALLAVGGALGFLGYLRAHGGVKDPSSHNVTATLAFLTAGVLAAFSVAGVVFVTTIQTWRELWDGPSLLVPGALFATANLVWAFAGIAWMQRLMDRYAETTGRAFDGLPVVLLFTAIALVIAATLKTMTL
jgi:hypothetical protein